MKFQRFILSGIVGLGLIGLPGTIGYAKGNQVRYIPAPDEPEAIACQKTMDTKFSIALDSSDWWYLGTGNDEHDFFVFVKNINFRDRVITTWIREYDYRKNQVYNLRWSLNRNSAEIAGFVFVDYDLTTGETVASGNLNKIWDSIIPETISDKLLDLYNNNDNKSSKTFGKKAEKPKY